MKMKDITHLRPPPFDDCINDYIDSLYLNQDDLLIFVHPFHMYNPIIEFWMRIYMRILTTQPWTFTLTIYKSYWSNKFFKICILVYSYASLYPQTYNGYQV